MIAVMRPCECPVNPEKNSLNFVIFILQRSQIASTDAIWVKVIIGILICALPK